MSAKLFFTVISILSHARENLADWSIPTKYFNKVAATFMKLKLEKFFTKS